LGNHCRFRKYPYLKSNASNEQIALLDTYANHKWGWGAVNEGYFRNANGSINYIVAMLNTSGMLRCDDDYETRYDPDPGDNHDIRYPYDVKRGWTISREGLFSVMEFTHDLQQSGVNGTEEYHLTAHNCVWAAVEAINSAGIGFTCTPPVPSQFGEALVAAGGERI
jgi:hypothetical protein